MMPAVPVPTRRGQVAGGQIPGAVFEQTDRRNVQASIAAPNTRLRLPALAEDRVGVIEAFHQPIVRSKNGCSLPGPAHLHDRFESMPCGCVAEAEIIVPNCQETAWF